MPRPSNNYEPKKRELALTALELFIKHGYENTTVTEIMKAADLTKAGMYHYYTSKEEILDAAILYAIEQDYEHIQTQIKGLPPEEKMLAFTFTKGSTQPGELICKLLHYRYHDKNSYAAYRARELTTHAYIPIMEEIVKEGVIAGVYHTDYPKQAAEFMVLLGKSLSESNLLPQASKKESVNRLNAFLELMNRWLQPSAQHLAEFADMLKTELITNYAELSNEE